MRRYLIDGLLCIVAVCFAMAGMSAASRAAELRLATFSADMTPPLGTPIYPGYRPLAVVEHPLLAKGIVLEDGGRRYVLVAIDWCTLANGTYGMFRQKLAEAAGTEPSCVSVHTVHQHTAPMADADALVMLERIQAPPPHPDPQFFHDAAERLAKAIREAVARLEPFDRVGVGEARVHEVASTRRVPGPNGSIRVRYSSCRDATLRAASEGTIDPMLKTITFARGDKPLARLHFYATHPQSFYGADDPRASYDFAGTAREKLQEDEGVFQIYFTGCAGDVTAGKYNDGSPQARDRLAERLFAGMEAAIAATQWMPAGTIEWRTEDVVLPPRTDAGHTPADYRATLLDPGRPGTSRVYAAQRLAFVERAETPIEICCLKIGRAHILGLPGECMVEFQLYAARLLPDAFVATTAYGDDGPWYICTEEAFSKGGYEPTASGVAPESESVLKAAIRDLLQGKTDPEG